MPDIRIGTSAARCASSWTAEMGLRSLVIVLPSLVVAGNFIALGLQLQGVVHVHNDFAAIFLDGAQDLLLSQVEADYIILWFYRKGCGACSESSKYFKTSGKVKRLFSQKSIVLIPIDVGQYPDCAIEQYELQYYPTFYVLNRERQVLVKEASTARLDAFLDSLL